MKRVSLLLALFISASMFMVSCGGDTAAPAAEGEAVQEEAAPVVEETTPVAEEAAPAEEAIAENLVNGKAVYDKACVACHGAGIAGAAKLDDVARWEATAAKGLETVYANSINGFTGDNGAMPAKGGNATLTDQEMHDAVDFMLNEAGVTAN